MFLDKQTISLEKKVEAVNAYLSGKQPLRKVAQSLGIPYQTLWIWVKHYREGGEENLKRKKVHTRRLSKDIERQVMLAKEHYPGLSIKQAHTVLEKHGITISNNAIWHIWKRYGLTKRSIHDDPLTTFCRMTPELEEGLARAKRFIEQGDPKTAANIMNALPCLPEDPILKEVPEKFLSSRRKLDRLSLQYGEISFSQYWRKARTIGKILEKEGYRHSSIIANFMELSALDWIGEPRKKLAVLKILARKMRGMKNSTLWFFFFREQAIAYWSIQEIGKALAVSQKCRKLVYRLSSVHQELFGTLLSYLGKFREATSFYNMALSRENNPISIMRLKLRIAVAGCGNAGEYEDCRRLLAMVKNTAHLENFGPIFSNVAHAYASFGEGSLIQAQKFFLEALKKASKVELCNIIYVTSVGLASIAMAFDKKHEAVVYLTKYRSLMKRRGLSQVVLTLSQLSGSDDSISQELQKMPTMFLLHLLVRAGQTARAVDYRKAFNFAKQKKLLGLFHRWVVFFPQPVLKLLDKGKQTGLPKAMLRFPIFNQAIPVYHVKFLGDINVFKNRHYVKTILSPKETGFLLHVCLRAAAPGKSILIRELCHNFWRDSTDPDDRLLHLLSSIKRKLLMPGHLLSVSSRYPEPRLVNRGMYITTDYDEFETLLTQINSLERAGEWQYAKRDYERAFKLVRGPPFEKMYDAWSETMRGVIINKSEAAAIQFARSCLDHNDRDDARRVLKRMSIILPSSQEIVNLLRILQVHS